MHPVVAAPLHLRVFLSSPGDVADERNLARRVIKDELSVDPFLRERLFLTPVSWDDEHAPTPMVANLTPQEAVNRGLPKPSECDFVVVILWSRMGTPLPGDYRKPSGESYLSGTEWEVEDALGSDREPKPDVLLYRRTEHPPVKLNDPKLDEKREQYARVEAFFQRFRNPDGSARGSITEYATATEFAERLKHDLRTLLKPRVEALPSGPAPGELNLTPPPWEGSPYPGLRAFTSEESAIFFGRGREVDELIRRLRDLEERFLAVVGASGTGKSSLVRAGLLPRLKGNAMPGSKDWCVVDFTPGALSSDSFLALAAPLNNLLPAAKRRQRPADLAQELAETPALIVNLAGEILAERPEWVKLVLFADQLEELFTLVAEQHRAGFIELLARAEADERLRVLTTLRADFFAQATTSPTLAALLQGRTFPLAPPGQAALLDMIRRPAERAGLELEEGLADAILEDTGANPGALPLLAFVLAQLYQRRHAVGRLTLGAYNEVGRLKGAVSARAEEVMAQLPHESRSVLPRLFRAIVHVDRDGVVTGRHADLTEVATDETAAKLLDRLTESGARLLQGGERAGRPTIQVAHETLFESWPQLHEWLVGHRDLLLSRTEIEAALARWQREQRDPEFLLSGKRLREAVDLVTARPDLLQPDLEAEIREYIAASKQRAQERAQEEEERLRLESRRRARLSRDLTRSNPQLGLLLALEALPSNFDESNNMIEMDTVTTLCNALSMASRASRAFFNIDHIIPPRDGLGYVCIAAYRTLHGRSIRAAAFSADGQCVVTALADGTARIWFADTGKQGATLEEQTTSLVYVAFSPDGARYIIVFSNGMAQVWGIASGEPIATLLGHTGPVLSTAFSPDGARVVTASADGTARIWWATTGELINTFRGHGGLVSSAAFSPGGAHVLTASADGTAWIWRAGTGEPTATLLGHDGPIASAAFSPDGARVVTASADGTARIWWATTGELINTFRGHGGLVSTAAFSPDGAHVVTASGDGTARLWDAASGREITALGDNKEPIASAAFSPDGVRILTASRYGRARLWDAASGSEIAALGDHKEPVASAAFSPDGARVVISSTDGTAGIWRADTGEQIAALRGHGGPIASAAFGPDGVRILTASSYGPVELWDLASGAEIARPLDHWRHTGALDSVAFSPDGARVVTASADGTAQLWEAGSGRKIASLRGHKGPVASAAFSSDGARVVTASADGTARIWLADTGEQIQCLRGHEDSVSSAVFSPDGARVVTASADGTARICLADTGKPRVTLFGHDGAVLSAAFSPDGARVVTASADGTARIWLADTGEQIQCLRGHEDSVSSAVFSPDGARVVTGSSDETARLWDAASGAEVAALRGHDGPIVSAAFSPDGGRVLTASENGTTCIWQLFVGLQALVVEARRVAGRQLTVEEREWHYLPSV